MTDVEEFAAQQNKLFLLETEEQIDHQSKLCIETVYFTAYSATCFGLFISHRHDRCKNV